MKSPEWPHSHPARQGLVQVIVLLMVTNTLLLIALFTSDMRVSQTLWWPLRQTPRTTLPSQNCTDSNIPLISSTETLAATTTTITSSSASSSSFSSSSSSSSSSPSSNPEEGELGEGESYRVILNTTAMDLSRGEIRRLQPHGIASHLIIEFGAYRNGPRTFSIVSLISKRLHDLHEVPYACEWRPNEQSSNVVTGFAWPIKPDWELGTMYGTMVVVCEFGEEVGTDGKGGSIVLSVGYADEYRPEERFVAFTEAPRTYNATKYEPASFPYDITFCASRLYGSVNPERIREWMAYHALLFGPRAHFLFHDAGGLDADVYRVLRPWIDLGRVSVQNLQLLEVYQGRSHHQFTMLNDCMFRAQTLSNWTFFFDVDEYLYLDSAALGGMSVQGFLAESERNNVTQVRMRTVKMSDALCTANLGVNDSTRDAINSRKWAIEKLVYADCDYGWAPSETRKYALQPRKVFATGVHFAEYLKIGETLDVDPKVLRLYHYHGSIGVKSELCRDFTSGSNGEPNYLGIKNCTVDRTLTSHARRAQQYELDTIGMQPSRSL